MSSSAAARQSDLADHNLLGHLVSFTASDSGPHIEELRARLKENGLRSQLLKTRIRRVDAFKKATNEIATRFAQRDDQHRSLRVLPVGHDQGEAHRLVQLEHRTWRTGQRRRVEHDTLFRLMYDRGVHDDDGNVVDDHIAVERQLVPGLTLTADEQAWIDKAIGPDGDQLRMRFEHHATHLDGHGVRTFIRDYLAALDALQLQGSGGLYFVSQGHGCELQKLAKLLGAVGTCMYVIPLLDGPDQQRMLIDAFASDSTDTLRTISAEMERILGKSGRFIAQETYDSFTLRVEALSSRITAYETRLGCKFTEARESLTTLDLSVGLLEERVRRPRQLARG